MGLMSGRIAACAMAWAEAAFAAADGLRADVRALKALTVADEARLLAVDDEAAAAADGARADAAAEAHAVDAADAAAAAVAAVPRAAGVDANDARSETAAARAKAAGTPPAHMRRRGPPTPTQGGRDWLPSPMLYGCGV